jgi:hypothetical protein
MTTIRITPTGTLISIEGETDIRITYDAEGRVDGAYSSLMPKRGKKPAHVSYNDTMVGRRGARGDRTVASLTQGDEIKIIVEW